MELLDPESSLAPECDDILSPKYGFNSRTLSLMKLVICTLVHCVGEHLDSANHKASLTTAGCRLFQPHDPGMLEGHSGTSTPNTCFENCHLDFLNSR